MDKSLSDPPHYKHKYAIHGMIEDKESPGECKLKELRKIHAKVIRIVCSE